LRTRATEPRAELRQRARRLAGDQQPFGPAVQQDDAARLADSVSSRKSLRTLTAASPAGQQVQRLIQRQAHHGGIAADQVG
jgi:hypothetical protein